MENVLKNKRKICIEWKVKGRTPLISETFLLQGENCNLEFYTGIRGGGFLPSTPPYLSFQCSGKLHLPINATLRIRKDFDACSLTDISITNAYQKIWSSTVDELLNDHRMFFELIFHADNSGDDKAVQTSPYIDIKVQSEAASKDFSALFYAGPNRDVEFLCGEETIKAHKDVICCRSTVFASMLGTDMQEGKTGQIKIQDMESSIFRQFLQYLYTGMFPDLTYDAILRMYQAADKYAVDSLKKQCATFLTDNLSLENVCEVLILSDRHNDMDLKKFVIEYMLNEEIPRRIGESWIDFSKENMTLANEVLYTYYMNSSRAGHASEK